MNWQKIILPVLGVALVAIAWNRYGAAGGALAATAVVMYLLLHFNRLMHVLRKAADRPKGYVGSAVMLNAKLKTGVNLMHVMALTESIGEPLTPNGQEPARYRWTDGTQSHVTCEFVRDRLASWVLFRPEDPAPGADLPAP